MGMGYLVIITQYNFRLITLSPVCLLSANDMCDLTFTSIVPYSNDVGIHFIAVLVASTLKFKFFKNNVVMSV